MRQNPDLNVKRSLAPSSTSEVKSCLTFVGAANRIRTGDLILTKDVLCRLSHSSKKKNWQGQKDLNPRHAVLETAALPTEPYPYVVGLHGLEPWTDRL